MEFEAIIIFSSALIFLNVLVTYSVLKDKNIENKQKYFQLLIIWLIPVIGAIIEWYIYRETRKYVKKATHHKSGVEDSSARYIATDSPGSESGD